jgi:predicted 2-oxoglutarate/Fe(II)-dependent dioxygenase YbiX
MTQTFAPGEPAPWFHAPTLSGNPRFTFDTVAGRWTMLLFLGSGAAKASRAAFDLLKRNRDLFDDARACFFGVTVDPTDAAQGRIAQALPGIRWFLDYDRAVSIRYGAMQDAAGESLSYLPHWLLLDPMLRVRGRAPMTNGAALMDELRLLSAEPYDLPAAPVLVVPNVLPPELCSKLIDLYEADGGEESGFMREENGITVERRDPEHKRRSDYYIEDQRLIGELKTRLARALAPMMQRALQFHPTRIERYLVACYDGGEMGHFRAHRDNTTKGTAHRKFACTINLNAGEYEGGDLSFPEFGPRTYRAPTGGAVIFSCSLLHEARPVTKGRRYAFLPFFYDEDGARLRERNLAHVAPDLQNYASGLPPEPEAAGKPEDAPNVA